jgi:hypothetical protein
VGSIVPPAGRSVRLLLSASQDDTEADSGLRTSARGNAPGGSAGVAPAKQAFEVRVLRILRANPHANWRLVRDRTGLTDVKARRALTAARKRLRATAQEEAQAAGG